MTNMWDARLDTHKHKPVTDVNFGVIKIAKKMYFFENFNLKARAN